MDKFFRLEQNGTTVKREVIGGLTTFLTMAYIIIVNPLILSGTGMDQGALVTATCITAAFATILMGITANLPLALASGMGLNASFLIFSQKIGPEGWKVALLAVLIEGIIFIILSLLKVREAVVNAIPNNLKIAVSAGIGLFIAFIGFKGTGLVVGAPHPTLVTAGKFTQPTVLITLLGILVIVLLETKKVRGSILWGILVSTVVAWTYAIISPESAAQYQIFVPNKIFEFNSVSPIAFKFDWSYLSIEKIGALFSIVIAFLFVDFFDTVGTLVGVASKANLVDKEGKVKNAGKALLVDAIGTTVGAVVGTSTVTTFVESSAGVADGARTGLASIVTGILFLFAMFFAPIFICVPACATAPALIVVGFFMIQNIGKIDFTDFTEGVPAFLTISLMTVIGIGEGLTYGIMSYGVINVLYNLLQKDSEKKKKVSWVIIILTILFLAKLIFLH
ncbi:NCS2 family permease [Oceanirhabdus sp. W0125-5]|uniref:NCS2 family permease n=1 Tax=Oceanirhabdus sp. W0125-5 TaxID=2999116 RepID=UPI0022F2CF29|nr:NCS2 family permease [Oceanirhabdus sp. W0125-5]WBW94773.1 NCS2 family permease [Oceanirhabdus sp. W0125-5]